MISINYFRPFVTNTVHDTRAPELKYEVKKKKKPEENYPHLLNQIFFSLYLNDGRAIYFF